MRSGSRRRRPSSCLRILARRQPDVVLGGGGYVAGPMVLAAWLRRIPAALTEADAHLGLANRLATPFVQRLFLAYPIDGANGKTRVVGRPIPARARRSRRQARARASGCRRTGPVVLVFGGSQGARTLNEMAVDAWGDAGPAVLHLSGERDYDELRGRVLETTTGCFPSSTTSAPRCRSRHRRLARGRLGLGDRGRRAAGDPRAVSARDLNHQAKNAEYFDARGRRAHRRRRSAHALGAAARCGAARRPRTLRQRMSDAMRAAAKPDAADKIADELVALAAAHR